MEDTSEVKTPHPQSCETAYYHIHKQSLRKLSTLVEADSLKNISQRYYQHFIWNIIKGI